MTFLKSQSYWVTGPRLKPRFVNIETHTPSLLPGHPLCLGMGSQVNQAWPWVTFASQWKPEFRLKREAESPPCCAVRGQLKQDMCLHIWNQMSGPGHIPETLTLWLKRSSFLPLRFRECFAEEWRECGAAGGCSKWEPLWGARKWCWSRDQTASLPSREARAAVLKVRSQASCTPSPGNLLEITGAQVPHQTHWIRNWGWGAACYFNKPFSSFCCLLKFGNHCPGRRCPQKEGEVSGPGFPWYRTRLCSPKSRLHHHSFSLPLLWPHCSKECPSWPHSYWAQLRESLWHMDLWAGVTCDATSSVISRGFHCACLGLLNLCHPPWEPDVPDREGMGAGGGFLSLGSTTERHISSGPEVNPKPQPPHRPMSRK